MSSTAQEIWSDVLADPQIEQIARNAVKTKEEIPWEGRRFGEAHNFALRCAELRDSNPYKQPAFDCMIIGGLNGRNTPDCAEPVIGRRSAPGRGPHPGYMTVTY